ncbi:MAG: lipoyl(octanoyl) transferase LipB [Chloroflexi bacterium]|nr:MAG: lipoyl(octanoyl) transferase LipB [Chloroflexota bacterium]MBL1194413.1 lipoyl(octanoyl) transferase LipB [Chloroflexota bacterium]NOH11701.1 lipoyl(octanoyl) transferase LipB [Chloroflexota bacterium]
MSQDCQVYHLGQIEYQKAWNLQNQLAEQIAAGEQPPTLLLLEHSHVYTFGRQGSEDNLLWDEEQLKQNVVDVHWVDRGGDVTYHGPGQLVAYPLLPLGAGSMNQVNGKARMPKGDYVAYLRLLEKIIIKTLAHYGVVSGQRKGMTGVWVQPDVLSRCVHCPPAQRQSPAKIASIGVKVDVKGVTRHGFALNVNPDMSYWDGIVACGLDEQNKASLAYFYEEPPSMDEVADKVIQTFGEVFGYEMRVPEGVLQL